MASLNSFHILVFALVTSIANALSSRIRHWATLADQPNSTSLMSLSGMGATGLEAYIARQHDVLRAAKFGQEAVARPKKKQPVLHGGKTKEELRKSFETYEGTPIFVFAAYHKTGCELAVNMLARLNHADDADDINMVGDALELNRTNVFLTGYWDNFWYEPRLGILNLLPDFRMVHFIRDPADIIVSAYRFHTQCPPGEPWLLQPMTTLNQLDNVKTKVGEVNRSLLMKFNHYVDQGISLCQLYQQEDISEQEGILIEGYRSQYELELMANNYKKTAADRRVLQVPMEGILTNFDASMSCIFNFLGTSRWINQANAMRKVAPLDVSKIPETVHVTTGKFDNADIKAIVDQMPHVVAMKQTMLQHQPTAQRCGDF